MLKSKNKNKKIRKIATIWLESTQPRKENKQNAILYWKKRIRPSN